MKILDEVLEQTFKYAKKRAPVYHFFGGEPLLMFDLLKYGVQKINWAFIQGKIGYPFFAITTNATVLPRAAFDFLKEYDFLVGVSIDGPREIHDQLRPFANGQGSYEVVCKNYHKLHEYGIRTHVLVTPNPKYMDHLVDYVVEILDDFPMETITINTPFHYDTLAWNLDGAEYAKALVEIWRIAKERSVSVDSALSPILAALSNEVRRATPCSITGDRFMASVSPSGEISYCAQKWQHELALSNRPNDCRDNTCKGCYALGYCGGVCPAFKTLSGKKLDQNKCDFMHAALPLIVRNLDIFMD